MPTDAERNALLFLASLAVLGAGVRVVESYRFDREVAGAADTARSAGSRSMGERALTSQIAAVDSARAARTERSERAKVSKPPRARKVTEERDRPNVSNLNGSGSGAMVPTINKRKGQSALLEPVNINRASATELERLPRVGPALAARIITWREQHGPFRTIEDLRHVRGIGPTTAALLAPSVTF